MSANGGTSNAPTRVEISRPLVLINSASSLVVMGLNAFVMIWLQRYLLKRITPEEYSLLPVLYSLMMFAPLLTIILTQGLARYIVEAYAANDEERVTRIVSTMFPILLVTGCLIALAGAFLAIHLDGFLTIAPKYLQEAKLMFLLLMLCLALRLPLAPFTLGLEVRQKFVLSNLIMTVAQLLRIVCIFLFITLLSPKVLWIIVSTAGTEVLTMFVLQALSRRYVPSLRLSARSITWPIAKDLLSFGGWSTLTGIGVAIRNNSDAIILNKLGTPFDVTCFYLGSLPLEFIQRASSAVQGPLQPVLTALYATGAHGRLSRLYLKGGRWALWASLFVATPAMCYSTELVTLYVGSKYSVAGIVLFMLLLLLPIGYGNTMLFSIAQATGNIRRLSLCYLGMSLFNLGLTFFFVGVLRMGAIGSSLATTVALALFYPAFIWPMGMKIVGVGAKTWLKETLWPGLLPAAVETIMLLSLKQVFVLDDWFTIGACGMISSLTYILVLWWALRSEDRNEIDRACESIAQWPVFKLIMRREYE